MVSPFGEGGGTTQPACLPVNIEKKNTVSMQCKDDPIYVFPEMKLCCIVPNSIFMYL
jgi:hypothetical protein